jgi:hypothetical protein
MNVVSIALQESGTSAKIQDVQDQVQGTGTGTVEKGKKTRGLTAERESTIASSPGPSVYSVTPIVLVSYTGCYTLANIHSISLIICNYYIYVHELVNIMGFSPVGSPVRDFQPGNCQ